LERCVVPRLRLLSLACLRAALVAAAALILADLPAAGGLDPDAVRQAVLLIGAGAAVGAAAAGFQTHPRRALGLIPIAATGLFGALLAAVFNPLPWFPILAMTLGLFAGVAGPAFRAATQAAVPVRLPATPIDAVGAVLALLLLALIGAGVLSPAGAWCGALAAVLGLVAFAAWLLLFIPALELVVEWLVWPMYDIVAHGPGADRIPRRGPLLVVANHSSYADPFWVSKVVPRKVVPMMTSVFYDLPGLRWMMGHLVGAIRVQAATFRREAPELREVVDRLRRGRCVLLFPEGTLRKREEQLLLPFGQGIWHILKELPQTPVVVCWIEGGWGSFASYCAGPPMKNKRLDFRRRIDIYLSEPLILDALMLADHRTTRDHLRRACLACRRGLGLAAPREDVPSDACNGQGSDEAAEAQPDRSVNERS
jgi:1-acyl-sn-glycerol-3-phosphate acyltransferase